MGYNFDWVVLKNHENVVWLKVKLFEDFSRILSKTILSIKP